MISEIRVWSPETMVSPSMVLPSMVLPSFGLVRVGRGALCWQWCGKA